MLCCKYRTAAAGAEESAPRSSSPPATGTATVPVTPTSVAAPVAVSPEEKHKHFIEEQERLAIARINEAQNKHMGEQLIQMFIVVVWVAPTGKRCAVLGQRGVYTIEFGAMCHLWVDELCVRYISQHILIEQCLV